MPNQLRHELSPYLLEHADNPVDWRPWGEEAIALARAVQKPIFLSIGYSACHWCHVMARESFEDPEIARLLNEQFVSIKVDREERPELDQIYMEAVQAMTGNGGWPLSVFLTPECEPFFGGTYWPPRASGSAGAGRPGMAGFDQVLQAVADAWRDRRDEVRRQAGRITGLLKSHAAGHGLSRRQPEPVAPGLLAKSLEEISQEAESALRSSFDPAHGGFSAAPKFPQPLALRWLLRRWRRTGDETLLQMVAATLDGMAAGGIFDHLGGGFHRYTVDARWLTPHFEKMLYDNALLALGYVEAWQATGQPRYAAVARQTLDYLLADLSDPQGGFYSAEDADSEGREGTFYLWTPREVEAVLEPEIAKTFCRVYDVTDEGNFEGRNILHLSRPLGGKGVRRLCRNGPPGASHKRCLTPFPPPATPASWLPKWPPPGISSPPPGGFGSAPSATRRCWFAGTAWPSRRWPAPGPRWASRATARPPLPRPNSCWPACARPRAGSCTAGARRGQAQRLSRRLCRTGRRAGGAWRYEVRRVRETHRSRAFHAPYVARPGRRAGR